MTLLATPLLHDARGFWIPVAAVLAAAVAAWFGRQSAKQAKVSADIAKDSSEIARSAAASSQTAAEAALKSAEADGKLAKVELGRDHHANGPHLSADGFQIRPIESALPNPRNEQPDGLFYVFTPVRGYVMTVFKVAGNERTAIKGPQACQTGIPVDVFVQELRPSRDMATVQRLEFEVWPGTADGVTPDDWECPCGAPQNGAPKPHWVKRVHVVTPTRGVEG